MKKIDIKRLMNAKGFTLIELMIVVAIIGILAVLAIPALQKWIKKGKAAEAPLQIASIAKGAEGYFKSEHGERGATQFLSEGGLVQSLAPHRCPHPLDQPEGGMTEITPPIDFNCNEGPGGKCIPGAGGAGYYPLALWNDNPMWNDLQFMMEKGHYFHYNFISENSDLQGYGRCQFTVQAFADLDNDQIFSTYEQTGAGDIEGVNMAIALHSSNELE
jgi:prepilin-type N-terminal cleavage/methylation domain-containing protein